MQGSTSMAWRRLLEAERLPIVMQPIKVRRFGANLTRRAPSSGYGTGEVPRCWSAGRLLAPPRPYSSIISGRLNTAYKEYSPGNGIQSVSSTDSRSDYPDHWLRGHHSGNCLCRWEENHPNRTPTRPIPREMGR